MLISKKLSTLGDCVDEDEDGNNSNDDDNVDDKDKSDSFSSRIQIQPLIRLGLIKKRSEKFITKIQLIMR